ncbi:hypothetical protein JTB14_006837 [Gonioctena quinquepunctata]|nr:hypothetical protein JTB14_006837 [Gonioctena quinquepunctata]
MADSEDSLPNEKTILSPDHPLLEKFQQALKEHLLLQINRMKDDIFEIENETKDKNAEREELGVQTYEAQQMVCRQQKTLEKIISDLQTVNAAKEEVENDLEKQKQVHKELVDKYQQTEKQKEKFKRD